MPQRFRATAQGANRPSVEWKACAKNLPPDTSARYLPVKAASTPLRQFVQRLISVLPAPYKQKQQHQPHGYKWRITLGVGAHCQHKYRDGGQLRIKILKELRKLGHYVSDQKHQHA